MNRLSESGEFELSKNKNSSSSGVELAAMAATALMYCVWMALMHLLVDNKSSQSHIIVFLITLTRFFLEWVPDLKEKPLTFKTVTLEWLLLPMLYTAVVAVVMAGIINFLMPAIRSLLD